MGGLRLIGIVLIVGGVLGLIYGGFTYTKKNHEAHLGPVVLSVKEKETVNVPLWISVAAVVVGGVMVMSGRKN
jgi:TRAP-type C4-dicarboxylate transport system permease small subunit